MSEAITRDGYRAGPFRGLGHRFELVTQDPALTDALATLYTPLRTGAPPGGEATEYVVEPPVPGQLWQLQVDGRVTVRSSTPGGAVRMLLQSVGDGIRRGPLAEEGPPPRGVLYLDGAAVEIDGTGVLLLAERGVDLTAVLVRLLDGGEGAVGYLGEVGVAVDVDGALMRGAPTPLSLREEHWAAMAHLRDLVPDGIVPYLDLTWPLPAAALGRIVDRATLGVVLHLGGSETSPDAPDDAEAASSPDVEVEPLGPAVAATQLVDRLPYAERAGLTVERLREVAGLVEQVDSFRVLAGPGPGAVAEAVVAAVRTRSRHRSSTLALG
ncbi:MAG: hypothetical protein R6V28_02935 [Nitriliruptoraceae bacterium]